MKTALAFVVTLTAAFALHAKGQQWVPFNVPAPGTPQVFYSPSTAKIENDRGTKVRAVDIKSVAVDGTEVRETWKVVLSECKPLPRHYVDVSIYSNGQWAGVQRQLSLTSTKMANTRMARAACGLPL